MRGIALGVALVLGGCEAPHDAVQTRAGACPDLAVDGEIGARERCLFETTITPYLADPLWRDRDAYDASHYLLVPLRAAYEAPDHHWQVRFADHFADFLEHTDELTDDRLGRLQYLYLASQFAVLAARHRPEHVPADLLGFLEGEVHQMWTREPAWQWGTDPFDSMRDRVEWKLAEWDPVVSYHRAIIDEEHFLFVVAADLVTLANMRGVPPSPASLSAVFAADRVYGQEVLHLPTGGWLFQPGVWDDHRDWEHAGTEDMPPAGPAPVDGVSLDTSHGHRFGYWLRSLHDAHDPESATAQEYRDLMRGLAVQFFDVAAVPPDDEIPYWRTYNYLDGRNGVFRWDFPTQPDTGYGPYELSGTLSLGWWSGLRLHPVRMMYRDMAERFPLSTEEIDTYVGPNTTRERHPLVTLPAAYDNGFFELLARLAARVPRPHDSGSVRDRWSG